jgi:large subunit ribosomal protein L9
MKVVFLQDVHNVARAGEIKDVADGYARNYLIPKQLAAQADPRMMNVIEARIKAGARIAAQTESEMLELAGLLDGQEITLKARSGAKDRLYGSVTPADIAAEIEKVTNCVIDKRKIELENPVRQLGSYEIPIKLAREIVPTILLTVVEEES